MSLARHIAPLTPEEPEEAHPETDSTAEVHADGDHSAPSPLSEFGSRLRKPAPARRSLAPLASVILVEQDPRLLRQISFALPEAWEAQQFASLEEADGARLAPGRPAVLVLGPSQADAGTLQQMRALLGTAPGLGAVLVLEEVSPEMMRLALRAGVSDAIELSSTSTALAGAIDDLARQLEGDIAGLSGTAREPKQPTTPRPGFVTAVFSPKGGAGKSVVAVNLAASLAKDAGPVVLVDLDLQFGDAAIMLRLQPVHTFTDAAGAGEELDHTLLRSFLARHDKSGLNLLAAPTSFSEAEEISPASMLAVLGLLREMFRHVVIDTPPHLSELVLQALAASDAVAFVVGLDVPSVKDASLGLQAFELIGLPVSKVLIILNRAGSHVYLAERDVERALEMRVDVSLPSEATVPQSVNQGSPMVIEYPRSRFTSQVHRLADLISSRAAAARTSGQR